MSTGPAGSEPIHVVVPGSIDQRTGGYLYDARMVSALRARGRSVVVHELVGRFPDPDARAARSLADALATLPTGAVVVIDGLAAGGNPEVLASEGGRLRIVALVHHPLADETGLGEERADRFFRTERAALAAARGVVVTSPFTARRLEAFDVDALRVRVAVPGTDAAPPAPTAAAGETPLLLCVASLTPRKGHDVLAAALHGVTDVPWRCVFAGSDALDPAHAARVRARVRSLGLEARIEFRGELGREALDALYAEATLFVLASYYEGYGMALTEALARGVPVVSTTGGAIPHTVPADAGLLVAPGDVPALSAMLRSALTGPDTLATLRAGARRAADALPDWAAASRVFEEAVDELAARPAPERAA